MYDLMLCGLYINSWNALRIPILSKRLPSSFLSALGIFGQRLKMAPALFVRLLHRDLFHLMPRCTGVSTITLFNLCVEFSLGLAILRGAVYKYTSHGFFLALYWLTSEKSSDGTAVSISHSFDFTNLTLVQILKYEDELMSLLHLLHEKTFSKRGYSWAGKLLSSILLTLIHTYPLENKFVNPKEWDSEGI